MILISRSVIVVLITITITIVFATSYGRSACADDDPLRHGHALLIGIYQYEDKDWDQLPDIPLQLTSLKLELNQHFDTVDTVKNLRATDLWQTIDHFLRAYGNDSNARLLIYYAGHGYTEVLKQFNENRGYITGIDTPSTKKRTTAAYKAARQKSISMKIITGILEDIVAKHVLFIFDSCFSGTIFTSRSDGSSTADSE